MSAKFQLNTHIEDEGRSENNLQSIMMESPEDDTESARKLSLLRNSDINIRYKSDIVLSFA